MGLLNPIDVRSRMRSQKKNRSSGQMRTIKKAHNRGDFFESADKRTTDFVRGQFICPLVNPRHVCVWRDQRTADNPPYTPYYFFK